VGGPIYSSRRGNRSDARADPGYQGLRTRKGAADYQGGRVLQVMVERLDELSMSVDNCVEVSGVVSEALDVESPIEGTYQLEVSSPGIERPLMNEEDFRRYMGYDVSVTLSKGCKEIRGRIVEATEGGVALACEGIERRTISYAQISKAKLLLTDSLLKAAPNVKR